MKEFNSSCFSFNLKAKRQIYVNKKEGIFYLSSISCTDLLSMLVPSYVVTANLIVMMNSSETLTYGSILHRESNRFEELFSEFSSDIDPNKITKVLENSKQFLYEYNFEVNKMGIISTVYPTSILLKSQIMSTFILEAFKPQSGMIECYNLASSFDKRLLDVNNFIVQHKSDIIPDIFNYFICGIDKT